MADEIAKLVVVIDSTSAKAAAKDLDDLGKAGERASSAVSSSSSKIVQASNASLNRWADGLSKIKALSASSAEGAAKDFVEASKAIGRASSSSLSSWNSALSAIQAKSARTAAAMIVDEERIAARSKQIAAASAEYRARQYVPTGGGVSAATRTQQNAAAAASFLETQLQKVDHETDRAIHKAQQLAKAQGTAGTAMVKAGHAAEGAAKGHHALSFSSGQVVREYAVLVNELQRGDFTRFQGSLMTLANRTNLVQYAFTGMGVAVLSAAVILGSFAIAAAKGSLEQHEFNKSIALTGNFAQTSYGELMVLARGMTDSATSIGEARAALQAAASSGRFFREELAQVSKGVVEMSRLTGKSAEEMVKEFARLKDDPLQAITELNKTMHFLTEATRDAIRHAQEHGNVVKASEIAINALTAATADYADKADRDIGFIVDRWRALKKVISEAAQAMLDFGKKATLQDEIEEARGKLKGAQQAIDQRQSPTFHGTMVAPLMELASTTETLENNYRSAHDALAALQKRQADVSSTEAAASATSKLTEQNLKDTQVSHERRLQYDRGYRREHEMAVETERYARMIAFVGDNTKKVTYLQGELAESLDAIRRRYKDYRDEAVRLTDAQKEARKEATANAREYESLTTAIAGNLAVVREERDGTVKLTELQKWAAKMIADLDGVYSHLTTTQKGKIKADIDEVLMIDAGNKARDLQNKLMEINTRYDTKAAEAKESRAIAAEQELRTIILGSAQAEIANRLDEIRLRLQKNLNDLARDYRKENKEGSAEYIKQKEEMIRASQDLEKQELDAIAARKVAQGDWRNGARTAMKDYITEAEDVAGQTKTMWTNAFGAAEDAVMKFATTGKLSVKSLVVSILMDLAKIQLKIAMSKALQAIFGGILGGADPVSAASSGGAGLFSGPPSAKGNVFQNGSIIPFGLGGIVDRLTTFPMAGGRMGSMGEGNAPEAIMPLRRDSNGRLGVAGGGGTSISVSVNVNIAADGSATTQADAQGKNASDARQLGELVASKTRQTLVDEMRPGGMIWGMKHA